MKKIINVIIVSSSLFSGLINACQSDQNSFADTNDRKRKRTEEQEILACTSDNFLVQELPQKKRALPLSESLTLVDLPTEIRQQIIRYLDCESFANIMATNEKLRRDAASLLNVKKKKLNLWQKDSDGYKKNLDRLNKNFTKMGQKNNPRATKIAFYLGANINAFITENDYDGFNLLHFAALKSNKNLTHWLLKHKATIEMEAKTKGYLKNTSPLEIALLTNNPDGAEQLIRGGAQIDIIRRLQYPTRHVAAKMGYTTLLKFLIDRNIGANNERYTNRTPLHYAINSEIANISLQSGININTKDHFGNTPLHYIIQNLKVNPSQETSLQNSIDFVKFFITHGSTLDARNNFGNTIFDSAITKCRNAEIIQLIIDNGPKTIINIPDKHGRTPLANAAKTGVSNKIITLLLKNGANPTICDHEGKLPSQQTRSEKTKKLLHAAQIAYPAQD